MLLRCCFLQQPLTAKREQKTSRAFLTNPEHPKHVSYNFFGTRRDEAHVPLCSDRNTSDTNSPRIDTFGHNYITSTLVRWRNTLNRFIILPALTTIKFLLLERLGTMASSTRIHTTLHDKPLRFRNHTVVSRHQDHSGHSRDGKCDGLA